MRIWSVHPKYLDAKGLVALWREALLARSVLENKTTGYRNHPQLNRFRTFKYPVDAINSYLDAVYNEAQARNYNFDKKKTGIFKHNPLIPVNTGQVNYEFDHLMKKLNIRDHQRYLSLRDIKEPDLHPLFTKSEGGIEIWEKSVFPKD
jgi:hypothetical protein